MVTVQELQQLFYLDKLISYEQERLEALQEAADVRSPSFEEHPHSPGARDKLGDLVPEIADQREKIKAKIREYEQTKKRLESFIEQIRNPRIKIIMKYRFVELMTWQEVANAVGGRETEYTVKNVVYRYVGRMSEKK